MIPPLEPLEAVDAAPAAIINYRSCSHAATSPSAVRRHHTAGGTRPAKRVGRCHERTTEGTAPLARNTERNCRR